MHTANAGLSGYSTDQSERNVVSGLSPLPFVSPSLGLGPQMHPRLPESTSLASSPAYPAHLYSSPAGHTALLLQQQQHRYEHPTGALKYPSSTARPWLGSPIRAQDAAFKPEAVQDSQAGLFKAQHAQHSTGGDVPRAVRDSQARSPEAQHAQHSAGGPARLQEQTGFPRKTPASGNPTGGDLQADGGPVRDDDTNAVTDPVPALQTNLTAMDVAISRTAAAAVPVQPPHPVTAASSSQTKQAADPTPQAVVPAFLPVQAAVVPPQPAKSQANDLKPASSKPINSLPQQPQRVSLPARSFSPSVPPQPVSMVPTGRAPQLAQQAASLPPGNSAPIGPPAMRAVTCHVQGTLLQLAAPTLLPLLPTGEAAPYSTAATHMASAAADVIPPPMTAAAQGEPASRSGAVLNGVAGLQPDSIPKSQAMPEASKPEVAKDNKAGSAQQGLQLHPVGVSSQQAGQSTQQQVTVSAASTVMLDAARAAGTARQAALAVLNDTVQPVPASHSLPDKPFGSAQTSLAAAVGTSRQLAPIADLPPATAVGASRRLFPEADMPSATAVGFAPGAGPQALATMESMGRPQSLMAMTGPLPATGQGQEADSPVGGRPSQSETAVTVGRAGGIVSASQDLHAAHLVHVLQAHKVSQQLSDSRGEQLGARQQPGGALPGGSSLPRIPVSEHNAAGAPAAGDDQQNMCLGNLLDLTHVLGLPQQSKPE